MRFSVLKLKAVRLQILTARQALAPSANPSHGTALFDGTVGQLLAPLSYIFSAGPGG